MSTINKVITQTRNAECEDVGNQICEANVNYPIADDPYIAQLILLLKAVLSRMVEAIRRMKSESELEEKDEIRDSLIQDIYFILNGDARRFDFEIRTAALTLLPIFENYGLSITYQSFSVESALINSLISDFSKEENFEAISKISGLSEKIEELTRAQEDFERTRVKFEHDRRNELKLDSATVTKEELLELINDKIVVYLRAMLNVDPDKYGDFALTVGAIIDHSNEVVKKRRKRNEKEKQASS